MPLTFAPRMREEEERREGEKRWKFPFFFFLLLFFFIFLLVGFLFFQIFFLFFDYYHQLHSKIYMLPMGIFCWCSNVLKYASRKNFCNTQLATLTVRNPPTSIDLSLAKQKKFFHFFQGSESSEKRRKKKQLVIINWDLEVLINFHSYNRYAYLLSKIR